MPIDAISDSSRAQASVRPVHADQRSRNRVAALTDWLEAHAMFVIAVCAVLVISLMGIPQHLGQDGWLALVAGRSIAAHGIPQHDYFTSMTHGVRWVDQQWLAQWVMYELQQLGGLQLLTVLYVVITVIGFGGALTAARALGGEDLDVLVATVPGAFFYLVTAVSIRTQGFAYPLFVATLWLLASEVRSDVRTRRVYLVFPALALWGNLHGSVTLGVGLAMLYGLVVLTDNVRRDGIGGLADARALCFILISPLTLLATPYGSAMVHYYKVTLLNSQFSRMVTEWKPVMSVLGLAVPLFALIIVSGVIILRQWSRSRTARARVPQLFDVVTLAALAVGAIMAVRNVTWFGLALVVLLPVSITQAKGGRRAPLRRVRLNMLLAAAVVALSVVISMAVAVRPSNWFTSTYPRDAMPTLRGLLDHDPQARILADVRYADWLIWEDPKLFSGRVAYDTSFELLTPSELSAIADLAAKTKNARHLVDRFGIWMLYPENHSVNRTLLHRPGVHVVSRSRKVIIATNRPGTRA